MSQNFEICPKCKGICKTNCDDSLTFVCGRCWSAFTISFFDDCASKDFKEKMENYQYRNLRFSKHSK